MTIDRRGVQPLLFGAIVMLLASCTTPSGATARPPVIDGFEVTVAADLTAPAVVPFSWTVRDPNRDVLSCRIDFTSDGTWDETVSPCPETGGRNGSADAGVGTATFEVSDGYHAPVTATATYTVDAGPTEPYDIVVQQISPDSRVEEAIADGVARWTAVLARGVPDVVVHQAPGSCTGEMPGYDGAVDDIVIQVVIVPELWAMADAATCTDGPDGLPRLSIIRMNAGWIDWMYTHGYLGDLLAHEMGHAFGFSGAKWGGFQEQPEPGDYRFSGPRALAEWSRLGGTSTVPLSQSGDHWDELVLQSEIMTCYVENRTSHPLSALTVATMADIGYHVALESAEPWTLPPEPGYGFC